MDYQKYFKEMSIDELIDSRMESTGNDYLFFLALEMMIRFIAGTGNETLDDTLFYNSKNELEGLAFVGFFKKYPKYRDILENNRIYIEWDTSDYKAFYLYSVG